MSKVLDVAEHKLLLREERLRTDFPGSVHLLKEGKAYECVALYEDGVKVFEIETMEDEEREEVWNSMKISAARKRAKFDVTALLSAVNTENKSFKMPTNLKAPSASAIFYMLDADRFKNMTVQLVSAEQAEQLSLCLRMELPWTEVLSGMKTSTTFVQAFNTQMVFEELKFE